MSVTSPAYLQVGQNNGNLYNYEVSIKKQDHPSASEQLQPMLEHCHMSYESRDIGPFQKESVEEKESLVHCILSRGAGLARYE